MSQTCDQQRFTISEVAADWHGSALCQGRSQEFILTEARGLMASAVARAYNGGLGAEPPAAQRGPGAEPLVRGAKPP